MELLGTFYRVSQTVLVNSKTEHSQEFQTWFKLIKDHFDDFGTEFGQFYNPTVTRPFWGLAFANISMKTWCSYIASLKLFQKWRRWFPLSTLKCV